MHYLLLIYMDENRWAELPETERARIWEESEHFSRDTLKPHQMHSCAALHPVTTATTVRQRNGKALITDGPFAETKEMLAGYLSLECRDLGEAIAVAARVPIQRVGGAVEVRPVNSRQQ